MPTRRSPTGALSTLAVVLAALAVLVVVGDRPGVLRIGVPATSSTTTSAALMTTTTGVTTTTIGWSRLIHPAHHAPSRSGVTSPRVAHPTTTTLPIPTTVPPGVTTSTTGVATEVVSLSGTFRGSLPMTIHLGTVRVVTVQVAPGTMITLTVTCGADQDSSTSRSTVEVHVREPAAACVATFSTLRGTDADHWALTAT